MSTEKKSETRVEIDRLLLQLGQPPQDRQTSEQCEVWALSPSGLFAGTVTYLRNREPHEIVRFSVQGLKSRAAVETLLCNGLKTMAEASK